MDIPIAYVYTKGVMKNIISTSLPFRVITLYTHIRTIIDARLYLDLIWVSFLILDGMC